MLKLYPQSTGSSAVSLRRTPAAILFVLLTLSLSFNVDAFHYPWDQGHDTTDWNDPDNPGPCEGPNCDPCKSTGSPVYIPTGHLVWTESDIGFSGRPPISISRTYNSNDPRRGMFGNGWSTGCDMRLVPVVTSVDNPATGSQELVTDYALAFANGKRYVYETDRSILPIPPGAPVLSPPGRFDEVVPQPGGTNHLVDESGAVTVFGADGKLISSAEPTGQLLTNAYDAQGRLSQISDSNSRFVNFAYNASGFVGSITDHGGRVWSYTYDTDGNLTQVDDPAGGSRFYTYSPYTPTGDGNTYYQMTSVSDAANVVIGSFTFINDRVVAHTTGENTQSYTYNDASSQVTKSDSVGSQWIYTYNSEQVITQIRDPLGSTESFQYDSNGQLNQYTDYLGNTWTSTYDSTGRRLTTTNPLNETSTWSYQSDNPRPAVLTSTSGRTTQLAYNSQGNLTQITDAVGSISTLAYSPQGEIASVGNSLSNQVSISYNSIGLPQNTTDAVGRVTGFGYDAVGNLASVQNDDGDQYQFSYDSLNRLTSIASPSGQSINYARDVGGRVSAMTDPANNTIQNQWDQFGRLSTRTFADSRVKTFGRRIDNLITQNTAPDGLVTTYQYDGAKNLTQSDAGGEVTSFVYDANYQLVQANNATGTVNIAYDVLGRIISETTNGLSVTYQYDSEGQRTAMVSPAGTTNYSYDNRGLITQIAAPEGNYDFTYDALGRRTQITNPNSVTSAWGYNAADQLISLSYSGAYNASFGLSHGPNGLISGLTGDGANWSYQYDDDGALLQATHGTDTFSYSYDVAGNHAGDGEVVDSANRLVENGLFDFVYDQRGNLLSKAAKDGTSRVAYEWNNYDKLISYKTFPSTDPNAVPEKVIEYSYGPLGRMWSRTEDGVQERYVYDRGDRIMTIDAANVTTETVTYGTAVDEPLSIENAQGRRYLHSGINGSIVALTDATTVTDTYSYDPFGVTSVDTGSYDNVFRYTGREYEADDLYYYRSRFYDPTIRRYLSEDPAGFVAGELNLYRYVGNNPINFADPTGEIWPAVLVVWGAIEVGLAIYDAYDTYNTITDPCTGTWEKVFAGTLFVAGAALPGGGYSKADDVVKAADNYVDDVVDLADEGVIYRVPGSATDSGKPYVGRSDDLGQRTRNARDGRDRTQAEVIDTYPKGDIDAARAAEQRAINENGGVPNLDNKRNEIAPSKWGDFGIDN